MSLLFDNAVSSHYGTHCMVICKRWIITNTEESGYGLIRVSSLHLERDKKAGVPVEFRIRTSRIQVYRYTAMPICSVYVIDLIHKSVYKKAERTLRKQRFQKDEFTLILENSFFFCARIPENVHHKMVDKNIFYFTEFVLIYGPGVDSGSNRSEYQEYFLGVKRGRCVRLTTLPQSWAIVT
jgi:hypothetical protein